jgi:2-phosphoglycolate phosphatase
VRFSISAVLFDLDGTLADTAPDLAYSLNSTLTHQGRDPLPFGEIRPHVSHGAAALIRHGFGISPDDPEYDAIRNHFMKIYIDNICRETRIFEGMDQVLSALELRRIPWGVVTNKPSWLTGPLMDAMDLIHRAGCIISGDTLKYSKPHPAPILHACGLLGVTANEVLYIGDAERDIMAGKAAGTHTLTALFGYLHETDDPDSWNADGQICSPIEILDWIELV